MAKVKSANTLASTPSSSMLSPTRNQSPANYLKMLSEMRAGLSKMAKEVPDSRPPSPSRQFEKRVETLQEKVKEAYGLAGGDPAQGKWGHMASLLKMTCTVRGYRPWGLGLRRNHEVRRDRTWDWSSLETEQDWFEWERGQNKLKDAEDASLKAKVETWKADIAVAPDPNLVGVSAPNSSQVVVDSDETTGGYSIGQQGKGKGKGFNVKDPLPLAFPVVKRSSLATNGKKGKEKATSSQNNDEDPNSQQSTRRATDLPNGKGKSTSHVRTRKVSRPVDPLPVQPDSGVDINVATPAFISPKRIGDISEEYLPPSFPSDLGQSTPGPGKTIVPPPVVREKPPPITARRHSQLSLSSPPPSLNASPQSSPTPLRSKTLTHRDQGIPISQPLPTSTRKRARPLTPPSDDLFSGGKVARHALKKARTMPTVPHPSGLLVFNGSSPSTPPQLISSAKAPGSKSAASELAATPKRQVPTLTDLLRASTRKSKPSVTSSMRKINSTAKDHGKGKDKVQGPPSKRSSLSDASLRPVAQPYLSGLPAFSQNPGAFTPDFMSTQPPPVPSTGFLDMGIESAGGNGPESGDFFGVGYDSQFDLEKHADSVSELLERDVDFAGWMKQMPEDEGDSP